MAIGYWQPCTSQLAAPMDEYSRIMANLASGTTIPHHQTMANLPTGYNIGREYWTLSF